MVKTYFINGFLDSGKTSFIKNLLAQDFFNTGERTLILLCEEGDEEYDTESLEKRNIYLAEIDEENDFNPDYITEIEKRIKPSKVIIEFNGMWLRKNIEFPWYWNPPVEVTLINAETFDVFSKNMKSFMAEHVRNAKMAIFNRCDDRLDRLASYRRSIKAVNNGIDVVFEDRNGELNIRFDEDLPYDIKKDEIEIDDDSYAVFYLDAMENVDRYLNKKVMLKGMVFKSSEDNSGVMVVGRLIMTCCAEDISVFGFICDFEGDSKLEIDDWIILSAVVEKDYSEKYDLWYPVLKVDSFIKVQAPENEVIENI